jgi:transposase
MLSSLGIDVSKATLHVVLIMVDDKLRHKTCPNTAAGFQQLAGRLARHTSAPVHACLEATGSYGDAVALFLYDAGHTVSIVNPSAINAYAKAQQLRAKTDAVDAAVIARFCAKEQPRPWTPPPLELRQLQALVRRLDAVHGMRTQEANRLPVATDDVVRASIETLLAALDAQIADLKQRIATHLDQHPGLRAQRDLLVTIPGIGETTAAVLIAELFHKSYATARQAAAFAGATPRVRESGQWRGHATLSRCGPALVRKALYFPALAALRYNPTIAAVRARLSAKGKPNMVIVGAAMRHLIHVAFGVLKSQRAYDPTVARA